VLSHERRKEIRSVAGARVDRDENLHLGQPGPAARDRAHRDPGENFPMVPVNYLCLLGDQLERHLEFPIAQTLHEELVYLMVEPFSENFYIAGAVSHRELPTLTKQLFFQASLYRIRWCVGR